MTAFREGARGFLRQLVPDAAADESMLEFPVKRRAWAAGLVDLQRIHQPPALVRAAARPDRHACALAGRRKTKAPPEGDAFV